MPEIAAPFHAAPAFLPGSRNRTSSVGGLRFVGALSASAAEAVRGCSPTSQFKTFTNSTTTIKESK